jgi:SAM-dependent methyltransferase
MNKQNVYKFNEDVSYSGGYKYTQCGLSSVIANSRIDSFFKNSFDFQNKIVLDCGCGDGTYSFQYIKYGAKMVFGLEPAEKAVYSANQKAKKFFLEKKCIFHMGNVHEISDYFKNNKIPLIDVAILRGVLHHVFDPGGAVKAISASSNNLLIMEPNGSNPVLKIIEKVSKYHIEHEEQSFTLNQIKNWLIDAGYSQIKHKYINLVPFFCPDWFAKLANFLTPLVERIPILRVFLCAQIMIVAQKNLK